MSLLSRILEAKRRSLEGLAEGLSLRASPGPEPRTVLERVRRPGGGPLRLVCEIKRRSPSAGPLDTTLSVGERAVAYAEGGAAMISVLVDTPFFDGDWLHLDRARRALDDAGHATPLLAKEFVIDGLQLEAARTHGADAVLLIARITPAPELGRLVERSLALGLTPLVEVTTEGELEAALSTPARLVGVNARDLDTLAMDARRARRVLERIPGDRVRVHLSGLLDEGAVRAVAEGPADAALLGEALMREADPRPLLASLQRGAATPRR